MTNEEMIYWRASMVIPKEDIVDWGPAVIGDRYDFFHTTISDAITIWLKNGDMIVYKSITQAEET